MSYYHPMKKQPFWSSIITQTQGSTSISAGATVNVDVQPSSGETWLVDIGFGIIDEGATNRKRVIYQDYDGSTTREHVRKYWGQIATGAGASVYGIATCELIISRILTNTLYARLTAYDSAASTLTYGYSGFKLSQPQWTPIKALPLDTKPYKKTTDLSLPDPIKPLKKYKVEILGLDPNKPNDYCLAILLEEDTVLARDPRTGFPVERMSAYVPSDTLADLMTQFKQGKSSPDETGYTKYIMKWKNEGIDLGI
jgi:hypothetical protein